MIEPAAPGAPAPGVDLSPAAARILDRAERDRLVIFDPSSAPLLRPLIGPEELRPWHAAPSGRWALAIPAGYSAGPADEAAALDALQARHPAIGRHLRAHAAAATPRASGRWWELPSAPPPPPGPRILLGPAALAWDESDALVAAPLTVIPAAEPCWLALLWALAHGPTTASAPGRQAAQRPAGLTPGAFAPAWCAGIPAPARASLGGLALQAASIAGQLAEHERSVLRRLLADFGPPGARPGPQLARWWGLEFAELRAEIVAALGNDIPERFRPGWERAHAEQRADRAAAQARLAAVEATIDAQVAALLAGG